MAHRPQVHVPPVNNEEPPAVRILQIAAVPSSNMHDRLLYALLTDGTLWQLAGGGIWIRVDPPPPAHKASDV